jgi:hypothetical protein
MSRHKTAYELGLDALDLQLCLDTDDNQADYNGSRRTDEHEREAAENPEVTPSDGPTAFLPAPETGVSGS